VSADGTLRAKAFLGLAQLAVALGVAMFLSAGTMRWVNGWVFLLVFVGASLVVTLYLMKHDPGLLARRLEAGPAAEKRPRQQLIQVFASAGFLGVMIVPGLDHRHGWSRVPLPFVVLGELLVCAGLIIIFFVFKENSYASSTIEVGAGQKVIDTGPYARVRHPMYTGALIMLAGVPLALGSWWGLLTLVPLVGIVVWRLLDEEVLLGQQLAGYEDYRRRTRHRLIPHVW